MCIVLPTTTYFSFSFFAACCAPNYRLYSPVPSQVLLLKRGHAELSSSMVSLLPSMAKVVCFSYQRFPKISIDRIRKKTPAMKLKKSNWLQIFVLYWHTKQIVVNNCWNFLNSIDTVIVKNHFVCIKQDIFEVLR